MDFIKFLFTRIFLKNLLIAIIIAVILIVGTFAGIRIYTKHGDKFPVPNLKDMSLDSAISIITENNLRYSIYDSVYINGLEGGVVIDFFPDSGSMVKENRNIYLTITCYNAKMVMIPELVDVSFRKAQGQLKSLGLEIGTISYEPSDAENTVRRLLIDSTEVYAESLVPFGSTINVVLGQSVQERTHIPYLINMTLDSANQILKNAYLNMGAVIFDQTISSSEDSANALIYEQKPKADLKSTIKLASTIDVWLTINQTKIQVDTIFLQISDSLSKETE